MEDKIFIAKYVVGKLETEDIVKFVNEKLTNGVYSDHFINILDEEPKIWAIISSRFEEAINEIGYKIPTFENAIWVLVTHHITKISKGEVSPTRQFREMLDDIAGFSLHKGIKEYVGDNIGISRMYAWYHEDYCSVKEIDAGIYEESLNWVSEYGEKH